MQQEIKISCSPLYTIADDAGLNASYICQYFKTSKHTPIVRYWRYLLQVRLKLCLLYVQKLHIDCLHLCFFKDDMMQQL
jgi:hypothetical protein